MIYYGNCLGEWVDIEIEVDNLNIKTGTYTGTGTMLATIDPEITDPIKYFYVFQASKPFSQYDSTLKRTSQYHAIMIDEVGCNGIEKTSSGINVYQIIGGTSNDGVSICLNESDQTYHWIAIY